MRLQPPVTWSLAAGGLLVALAMSVGTAPAQTQGDGRQVIPGGAEHRPGSAGEGRQNIPGGAEMRPGQDRAVQPAPAPGGPPQVMTRSVGGSDPFNAAVATALTAVRDIEAINRSSPGNARATAALQRARLAQADAASAREEARKLQAAPPAAGAEARSARETALKALQDKAAKAADGAKAALAEARAATR